MRKEIDIKQAMCYNINRSESPTLRIEKNQNG